MARSNKSPLFHFGSCGFSSQGYN